MCYKELEPLNMTLVNGQESVFQQDSAPAHKANTTQVWLWRNLLALNATNWPLGSPDLNPLGCNLRTVLKDTACRKHHNNLESLKRSLIKAAAEIPLETACAVSFDLFHLPSDLYRYGSNT
jgi:hypothetical protein